MKTKPMTRKAFRATATTVSDEVWAVMQEEYCAPVAGRDTVLEYGNDGGDGGGWVIHIEGGKFWVHAWWYKPQPYDTLRAAENALFLWYSEFN